jgi:hypothetical protein
MKDNLELLKLQKEFRSGKIKEEDIPKEQLEKLKELYQSQIEFLENSIESDKQKILDIRRKLSNK